MKKDKVIGSIILSAALAVLATGCGGDDGYSSSSSTSGQQPQQPQTDQGVFTAQLTSENSSVAGTTNGSVEITVNGDTVTARVIVNGAPIGLHTQHIRAGTVCPTLSNDANGDGVIDGFEATNVSGKVLLPFDDDINSQDAGKGIYPVGQIYTYNKSGSLAQIISDLTATDPNPSDEFAKIPSGATQISLQGKVVEIHGVPSATNLPSTVASGSSTNNPHEDLPIACGVLFRSGTTGGGAGPGY